MAITKLQAVNLMLDAIGEKPVSSLTSGLADAEQAERMFDRVNTDVQSVGWNVNRDRKFELTRDADNKFPLPITTLSVDTVDEHNINDLLNVEDEEEDEYCNDENFSFSIE